MKRLLFLALLLLIGSQVWATPFPVKGEILDGEGLPKGEAHVYPRFVEIYDLEGNKLGKVGILAEKGLARIHMVKDAPGFPIVGYAHKGKIYNAKDKIIGTYFWTPTWSFAHFPDGKRAGSIKCIAWPRVCSVGVAGFLLGLYDFTPPAENENETP